MRKVLFIIALFFSLDAVAQPSDITKVDTEKLKEEISSDGLISFQFRLEDLIVELSKRLGEAETQSIILEKLQYLESLPKIVEIRGEKIPTEEIYFQRKGKLAEFLIFKANPKVIPFLRKWLQAGVSPQDSSKPFMAMTAISGIQAFRDRGEIPNLEKLFSSISDRDRFRFRDMIADALCALDDKRMAPVLMKDERLESITRCYCARLIADTLEGKQFILKLYEEYLTHIRKPEPRGVSSDQRVTYCLASAANKELISTLEKKAGYRSGPTR